MPYRPEFISTDNGGRTETTRAEPTSTAELQAEEGPAATGTVVAARRDARQVRQVRGAVCQLVHGVGGHPINVGADGQRRWNHRRRRSIVMTRHEAGMGATVAATGGDVVAADNT